MSDESYITAKYTLQSALEEFKAECEAEDEDFNMELDNLTSELE